MKLSTHLILGPGEWNKDMLEQYTFANPAYVKNERMGFSTRGIPPTIRVYEIRGSDLYIPRNKPPLGMAESEFNRVIDERCPGNEVRFADNITLKPDQIPAVAALTAVNDGILNAGCGKGKTVMFLKAMAETGVTTLVLVHKEFLMTQWIARATKVLGMKRDEIGTCQGSFGNWRWQGKKLVIGMLQSIHSNIERLPAGFTEYFGLVGADECHRMAAPTFNEVITRFPSQRRWGLTATLNRADGLEQIFFAHIGPVVYQLLGTNMKPMVARARTGINVNLRDFEGKNGQLNMSKLITGLTYHDDRNVKILRLLIRAAESGRRIIVLTERREHAAYLKESFDANAKQLGCQTYLYLGGMNSAERAEAEENADVFFSTYQMAKEGLDIPDLDTLFFATPVGTDITIEQALGRISRECEGKKQPMVVDFIDENIRPCLGLYRKRLNVYNRLELEIQ
jgi:superfamily II DNA or RNA helicase